MRLLRDVLWRADRRLTQPLARIPVSLLTAASYAEADYGLTGGPVTVHPDEKWDTTRRASKDAARPEGDRLSVGAAHRVLSRAGDKRHDAKRVPQVRLPLWQRPVSKAGPEPRGSGQLQGHSMASLDEERELLESLTPFGVPDEAGGASRACEGQRADYEVVAARKGARKGRP
jgi:hypothetical protein